MKGNNVWLGNGSFQLKQRAGTRAINIVSEGAKMVSKTINNLNILIKIKLNGKMYLYFTMDLMQQSRTFTGYRVCPSLTGSVPLTSPMHNKLD